MAEKPADLIAQFAETGDPATLQRAAELLEQMDLRAADGLAGRRELRRGALDAWVSLLNIIDDKLDPEFDPDDLPAVSVQPQPAGGVQFPPAVDPEAITDRLVRQEYQKAIEENRRKAQAYNLQHLLRRLEHRATRAIQTLARESYLPVPYDQQELATARQAIRKPERRSVLRP